MISQPEIEAAARRIAGHVRRTPVIEADIRLPGGEITVACKLELLQHTGSFKPRGAFNRMLSSRIPAAGVVAASGGNHGAAVAFAAQSLGIFAEVFVPATTPETKVRRIASYGAQVMQGGVTYADAARACLERQCKTGALNVHAYDHADVLAGQGTVGLELQAEAPGLTHILVATGGGGLIGGIAAWYAGSAQVISVEPEGCPTLRNALASGRPVQTPVSGLAADSLGASEVGEIMFPIARSFVAEAILVPDEAIIQAQALLWERLRLIAEPGGATALAGLVSGRFVPPPGAKVGVIICGANTDPAKVASP